VLTGCGRAWFDTSPRRQAMDVAGCHMGTSALADRIACMHWTGCLLLSAPQLGSTLTPDV
jgi:hypothetical protein